MRITNNTGINLPLAVWLLHDEYDYINQENYISVTGLMKPLKQTILTSRIPKDQRTEDVSDFVARTLGHAIHDSIEKAWHKGHARSMKLLGYPEHVIERIMINPTEEQLRSRNDPIPVYMEQREFREVIVDGVKFIIGGKYDMVADGELFDNKSTSAYTWLFGTRDDDNQQQGSLYKWLNPKKITGDHIHINYIFTDWSRMQARSNPKYPQKRVEQKSIPLWSEAETERWVVDRLRKFLAYKDLPEDQIPECNDKELWRSDPAYKYYTDPAKISGRSTKNFSDKAEADDFMASKGGKGVVITVPGEAKACNYCNAFDICKQKDGYL